MNKVDEMMTCLYVKVMSKKPGQGVIEYAGAMIVAALIVAGVLVIGQSGMGTVYNTLFTSIKSFFTTQTGNL
jgi:hypothetical protein